MKTKYEMWQALNEQVYSIREQLSKYNDYTIDNVDDDDEISFLGVLACNVDIGYQCTGNGKDIVSALVALMLKDEIYETIISTAYKDFHEVKKK